MGFLRRRPWRPAAGNEGAVVRVYGSEADESPNATVELLGNRGLILHVVPAYFDKILFNLTRMRSEQEALLARFERVLGIKLRELTDGDVDLLGFVRIVDQPGPVQLAEIRIEVIFRADAGRLAAKTHFKGWRTGQERLAEMGLYALFDWVVLECDRKPDLLEPILSRLAMQCALYRERGMPGLTDLGVAPFQALSGSATEPPAPPARRPASTGHDLEFEDERPRDEKQVVPDDELDRWEQDDERAEREGRRKIFSEADGTFTIEYLPEGLRWNEESDPVCAECGKPAETLDDGQYRLACGHRFSTAD
jgi:hypothetical protein